MQSTLQSQPSSSSSIKTVVETPHPVATAESPKIFGNQPQPCTPRTVYDENTPDSGYGSQASSATVTSNSHSACKAAERSTGYGPEKRTPNEGNLQLFNTRVDEALVARFNFIQPTIEFLLLQRLQRTSFFKVPRRHRPMVVRLSPVGTSELDAKLCIVVLCSPKMRKWVQDFFDTDETVISICKPEDASLPSFNVIALGKEPRLCNGETIVQALCNSHNSATDELARGEDDNLLDSLFEVPYFNEGTLCGTPIIVRADESTRRATLGGVVVLDYDNGKSKICGLTAGHVVRACYGNEEEQDKLGSDSDDDSNNGSALAGSVSSLRSEPNTPRLDTRLFEETSSNEESSDCRDPWVFEHFGVLGTLLLQSNDCQANPGPFKGSYDWALFDLGMWKPNRLPASTFQHEHTRYELSITEFWTKAPAAAAASFTASQCGIVVCGSNGARTGSLVFQSARILVDTGSMFVDAYMITLDDGNVLCDGDSGAWVVSEASHQVIGHVVATDPFGYGYIIPLCDIFRDIEQAKGVHTVSLPTSDQSLPLRAIRPYPPLASYLYPERYPSRPGSYSQDFAYYSGSHSIDSAYYSHRSSVTPESMNPGYPSSLVNSPPYGPYHLAPSPPQVLATLTGAHGRKSNKDRTEPKSDQSERDADNATQHMRSRIEGVIPRAPPTARTPHLVSQRRSAPTHANTRQHTEKGSGSGRKAGKDMTSGNTDGLLHTLEKAGTPAVGKELESRDDLAMFEGSKVKPNQRERGMERRQTIILPRRASSAEPGIRRSRAHYDESLYRWE